MILNHINLGVSEIPATVAMFESHFGLRRGAGMPLTARMAFLTDDAGALVSLFKVDDASYPKTFHIGFTRPTVQEVTDIHQRLAAAGFEPEAPREEHGRFTFYFRAPGGFTVEVNSFLPRG
jgi:lactoylglutathione lyase